MAGCLLAPLVLAAVSLPVFGQWEVEEEFSDANCTSSTGTEYKGLMTCTAYGEQFIAQTCEGGKIKNSLYSDSACGTLVMAGEAGEGFECHEDEGKYKKKTCAASLPDGYVAVTLTYYTTAADCTGTSMPYTITTQTDTCVNSEITTVTATGWTTKKYSTADCSGDATSTETTACGTCTASGGASFKSPCGVASEASAPAVSKVAVVALAGMAAFLA